MTSKIKTTLFTLILFLLPVAAILAVEGVLRLIHYGGSLDLFVLKKSGNVTEYVLNEHFPKRYFFHKGIKTPTPLSQTFSAHKDPSVYRVFCLGASTTQGFPYPPNGAYPAMLQNILSDLFPEKRIEVINCGITAITSHSVLDMEREILRKYRPDLLIIYTGQNEFYGVFGQASTLSLFKNRTLLHFFLKLQRSKLVLLTRNTLNDLFGKGIRAPEHSSKTLMSIMAKDIVIDLNGRVFENTLNQYYRNLAEMCRAAKKHQTPIMLCSLVDNRKDLPPFASKHCGNFSEKDTLKWNELCRNAAALLRQQRFEEAAEQLADALQIDSTYALTHYNLGRCYYALQQYDHARRHFQLAKDYDVIRFRAPSHFNSIIERVARTLDVPFVDCEKAFADASDHGIVGNNLLHEHVHPNLRGHLLIARTIAHTICDHALISDVWDWNTAQSDSAYAARCRLTKLDHEVAHYTIFRLTSQWPFTPEAGAVYQRLGDERTESLAKLLVDGGQKSLVELHLEYGDELLQQKAFAGAADEYQAALAIHPLALTCDLLGRLYLQKTELAFREKSDFAEAMASFEKGVAYFKEGLERWPDDLEMNFNLGLLYFMRTDETDNAVRQFCKVLELQPEHKNAHKLLIESYTRQREFQKAKFLSQKAIQLYPDDARFYTDLGIIFLLENNLDEAKKWLSTAAGMNDTKAKHFLLQVQDNLKQSVK